MVQRRENRDPSRNKRGTRKPEIRSEFISIEFGDLLMRRMDESGSDVSFTLRGMKFVSVAAGVMVGVVLLAMTAVAAGFLASTGARVAGMPVSQSGSFDLGLLIYFIFAGMAGAILFGPVSMGWYYFLDKKRGADPKSSMLVSAVAISLLAFPAGFACYKGSEIVAQNRYEAFQRSQERHNALYAQIRNDPAVVVRERWFVSQDGRKVAYEQSLSDVTIAYDAATIGELYASDAAHAPLLLAHRSIDERLLATRFNQALEELTERNKENAELFAILMNPKAKKEWFEAVAASGALKDESFPALKLLVASKLPSTGNPTGNFEENHRR